MTTLKKPSSIRTYFNALVVIILIVTSGIAAFLLWMYFQSQITIQTSNEYHMGTIVHTNNIKHDLQLMEGLLLNEEDLGIAPNKGEAAHSLSDIKDHINRIEDNIDSMSKLDNTFKEKMANESMISKLSERFRNFKTSVGNIQTRGNPDHIAIRQIFKPMHITLQQMESQHLSINASSLEEYRHYKGKFIQNFLILVVVMLISGLYIVAKAFSRMNQLLRESENPDYINPY
ncbi:MAG: hypothetical protein ACQ9MH_12580 [Nitrospinales bacterium]